MRENERGRGLGKALLRHGFNAYRDRGAERVGLKVDADNPTGAPQLYERVGFVVDRRYRDLVEEAVTTTATTVSLLRWLRRQLREPTPERERLEAAIANDDPAEARRLVDLMSFNDAQRRHLEQLLAEWEHASSH